MGDLLVKFQWRQSSEASQPFQEQFDIVVVVVVVVVAAGFHLFVCQKEDAIFPKEQVQQSPWHMDG
jgi:hypothetical protein